MRSSAVSGSSFSKISFFAAPSASLRGLKGLGGFTAPVRVARKLKQSIECALTPVGHPRNARGAEALRLRPAKFVLLHFYLFELPPVDPLEPVPPEPLEPLKPLEPLEPLEPL